MIDTHCHLTDPKFSGQVEAVLARAKEAGVERIIVPGTDLVDIRRVIELSESYENIYGLAGIYPGNVEEVGNLDEAIEKIEKIITENKKIIGIGEIGLDGYWSDRNIEKQKQFFKAQLELAVEKNVPVAIHSRKAEGPIREVFEEMERLPTGQFHCFGESEEFLNYVLKKGFYVSFCGNITYPSASSGRLRDLVKKVPLDRLLLETDSPYLAPEPIRQAQGKVQRGNLNEPANVKIMGEYIAKLLDVSPETLINQTTKNAKCLFFGG